MGKNITSLDCLEEQSWGEMFTTHPVPQIDKTAKTLGLPMFRKFKLGDRAHYILHVWRTKVLIFV